MKNRLNFLLLFVVFLFLVLGCDGGASSRGKILDEQGNPIKDAVIILELNDGEHKFQGWSQADGSYSLGGVIPPYKFKTQLFVSKIGYKPSIENFDSQEKLQGEHNVILKKSEPNEQK